MGVLFTYFQPESEVVRVGLTIKQQNHNDLLLYRVYINSIVIQQYLSRFGWGLCYAVN